MRRFTWNLIYASMIATTYVALAAGTIFAVNLLHALVG